MRLKQELVDKLLETKPEFTHALSEAVMQRCTPQWVSQRFMQVCIDAKQSIESTLLSNATQAQAQATDEIASGSFFTPRFQLKSADYVFREKHDGLDVHYRVTVDICNDATTIQKIIDDANANDMHHIFVAFVKIKILTHDFAFLETAMIPYIYQLEPTTEFNIIFPCVKFEFDEEQKNIVNGLAATAIQLLLFQNLCPVQILHCNPKSECKPNGDHRVENKSNRKFDVLGLAWMNTIMVGGCLVKGHWRRVWHGTGEEKSQRLTWIAPFAKGAYERKAGKLKEGSK